MAPTGSSLVDGHEKITENILARPRWQRPDRRRSMVMKKITENILARPGWHRPDRRRSMVMKKHREHFGSTEMAPTGSSPLDGREKHIEPRWHRLDRACSTGYVFSMVKKSRQLIV